MYHTCRLWSCWRVVGTRLYANTRTYSRAMTNLVVAKGCSLSNKCSKPVYEILFVILWTLSSNFMSIENTTCDYYAIVFLFSMRLDGHASFLRFRPCSTSHAYFSYPIWQIKCHLLTFRRSGMTRIKQHTRNSSNGTDDVTQNNVLFTTSFATNDRFSQFQVFAMCLVGFYAPYSMVHAVEAKTNDKIAMNEQLPRGSVACHCWPLRGSYTPLGPPVSSQRHRRHRVDIIHGCGWLKAHIGPQTQDELVFRQCIVVFFSSVSLAKNIGRPARPTCAQVIILLHEWTL